MDKSKLKTSTWIEPADRGRRIVAHVFARVGGAGCGRGDLGELLGGETVAHDFPPRTQLGNPTDTLQIV